MQFSTLDSIKKLCETQNKKFKTRATNLILPISFEGIPPPFPPFLYIYYVFYLLNTNQVESSTTVNVEESVTQEADEQVKKYWRLCNKLQSLETLRHEEKVKIASFTSNYQELEKYNNIYCIKPDQKEKIDSLFKHIEDNLQRMRDRSKETVESINLTHEKINLLKCAKTVQDYILDRGEPEKRKRQDDINEGRSQKRKKKSPRVDNSESSLSETEEIQIEEEVNNISIEGEDEVESIDYDDTEKYKNAVSGEKDEKLLGMYISVKWQGAWYKGRVIRWDDERKIYHVLYDGDDEEVEEHLTGPSKEKWEPAKVTRTLRKKTQKALALQLV